MKKVTAEQKIEALQHALVYLTITSMGICHVLPDTPGGRAIGAYIYDQLGGKLYLDNWLRWRRPSLPRNKRAMYQYRIQWLKWMIACLEEDIAARK